MARKKKPLIYCECGHETENPVLIGNVDAPDMHVTVCYRCVGKQEIRDVVELVFGPEMEARREAWDGMGKRQRARVISSVIKKRKEDE